VITDNPTDLASLYEALQNGPYGRCVYHCDNDVVDHQIVIMEMENGISVSFTMHGHSFEEGRTIRIDGSRATLLGKFGFNHTFIEICEQRGGKCERIDMPNNVEQGGHGGGAQRINDAIRKGTCGRAERRSYQRARFAGKPPDGFCRGRSAVEGNSDPYVGFSR
jgi:predicted dehydrogenase